MSSAGDDKKVVFDFRSKSMASTKTESPENNMVDTPEHLTLAQRTRSQTCPEPERPAGRFPKPAPVGTYTSNASPRPGHYDPRIGMKQRNNSDRWEQTRSFRSMSRDAREHCMGGIFAGPSGQSTLKAPVNAGRPAQSGYGLQHGNYAGKPITGKPVISHAQLVREAFICTTAQEMMKDFTSIVIEVKVQRGARVMWTSVPEDLKYIFNVTDIKTVDTWKQTMHGDCQLDISMFKRGDRVKMSVQSIGVSGKHMHQPLIRGVPDAVAHPETLAKSTETSPRIARAPSVHSVVSTCRSGGRSRANTVGTPPRSGETSGDELQEHPRFCVKKPEPAARFNRGNTKTFSQQRAKEFTHVSLRDRANS
jgi:hypothetical protein